MIDTLNNPIAPFDCLLGHIKSMHYITSDSDGKIIKKFHADSTGNLDKIIASCSDCGLILDFIQHDIALK